MFTRQVAPGIELRHFELQHAAELFAVVERNRVHLRQWLPWVDFTESADDIRRFIQRALNQNQANQGPQAAILIDGRIAGSVGCHPIDWANKHCSIGYWIDSQQQGRGLMTQCCASFLDYLFDELALHRVTIQCGTGNARSCAIPERLGFTREGVMREAEWVNDRWVDLVVWGMLEQDWRRTANVRATARTYGLK
jgi:ribosomal-protein-serine acetyltransferase